MIKKTVWVLVSCLMVVSMLITSCGQAEEEAKITEEGGQVITTKTEEEKVTEEEEVVPSPEVPKYGGTITVLVEPLLADSWGGLLGIGTGNPQQLAFNRLWDGDWTKGSAGGYGTNEVDWGEMTNVPQYKTGYLAESWRFEVNNTTNEVTTIFQIRQGIHFAVVDSEAGRLVNGRELTADDVVWNLDQRNNNPDAMNYQFYPQIRGIHPVKTGPWEVSITYPFKEFLGNMMRTVDCGVIFPPELYAKYNSDVGNWKNIVGTGPYIITDSIPANMTTLVRNPNYWMKDPIGPGKSNQLPYIQTVKMAVIPDRSTQFAALRTGTMDQLGMTWGFSLEEKNLMLQQFPELKWAARGSGCAWPAVMRVDQPPFDNIKVRRAMMMAIDLETINKNLYAGLGTYPSWPYYYAPAYKDLYMGLDDPICPDSVKELFTYNPDKAKQLLAEAGYPNGFKTELTLLNDYVDYYSIIKDYLMKINIDMSFKIIPDMGQMISVTGSGVYEMIVPGYPPNATYPEPTDYTSTSARYCTSRLNDPYVNDMADKARTAAITDMKAAMAITKELMPYLQDLAVCLQTPRYPTYALWWPWVKNYSGEISVGYFTGPTWVQYVWIDQELKKSMGY
jgi:peptide/nickel transport system substrate-binding protein